MAEEKKKSSIDDVIDRAIASRNSERGAPDEDAELWDLANAYMRTYQGGTRVDADPWEAGSYAPQRDKIVDLQSKLIRAGILDPDKIRTIGGFDDATRQAVHDLMQAKRAYFGNQSEDQVLNELAAGFIGWDYLKEQKRQGYVYQPRVFQPLPEEEVETSIESIARSVLGRDPRPEELQLVTETYRRLESSAYQGLEAADRAEFNARVSAADSGQDTVLPGRTVTPAPDPRAVALEKFEDTPDADAFKTAQLVSGMFDMLRRGY